jgi:hypothetical protein
MFVQRLVMKFTNMRSPSSHGVKYERSCCYERKVDMVLRGGMCY